MIRRSIPNTDLEVSTLCLGTMTFGSPVRETEAVYLTHWALDHGINFIDTADMYEGYARKPGSSGGVAETILGHALRSRRNRAVITTKVGNNVGPGSGLNALHMRRQIEASLKRLQTSYVDIYELHRPDPDTSLHETLATMSELMKEGKVRYWGISNFGPADIRRMITLCDQHGWPRPVMSQPRYNWLDRAVEAEHIPLCIQERLAVTPYQPLAGGLLTGKYRRGHPPPPDSRAAESAWLRAPDEAMMDRIDAFLAEAHAAHEPPARYAVRWLLQQPAVVSVVVGCKSVEQLSMLCESSGRAQK